MRLSEHFGGASIDYMVRSLSFDGPRPVAPMDRCRRLAVPQFSPEREAGYLYFVAAVLGVVERRGARR